MPRPRIPAAPARLMATPPVAAGAPALEIEVGWLPEAEEDDEDEDEDSVEELEVVAGWVKVAVTTDTEYEGPSGVDEAQGVDTEVK